jgi:hypothetical protein
MVLGGFHIQKRAIRVARHTIAAGAYFTTDVFYPGGIEGYAADYLSICAESGCY